MKGNRVKLQHQNESFTHKSFTMVDHDRSDTLTTLDSEESPTVEPSVSSFSMDLALFEPPLEAIKRPLATEGRFLRLIFGVERLDDFEEESLSKLKKGLQLLNFPSGTLFDDDRQKLRFLQGNKWVVEDCVNDMFRHLMWRKEFLPVLESSIRQLLDKGICYIHGRDKCLRPILIIRCKEMTSISHEEGIKVVLYWLEYSIRNLLFESKVEQWRVIIDLRECSTYSIPVRTLKEIALTLTKNYRGRLNEMFFINSNLFIWSIWQIVNTVLPETTRQKIRILTSEYNDALSKAIVNNQLEERFGGTCKNVSHFSKAIIPPGPFFLPKIPATTIYD